MSRSLDHLLALIDGATDDCVDEWPFSFIRGYPRVSIGKKGLQAHRYVCELTHGAPADPKMHAAHSCGNRRCVNPRHIRWLTAIDNIAEKKVHGTAAYGERHHVAKLTAATVRQIRERRPHSTLKSLAAEYGVSKSLIDAIAQGKLWRYPEAGFKEEVA